jgi:hypothetical protein
MKLPEDMKGCCDSLSSLHAIEHFGLGRYGDPIDINGHLKAITNLHLMLKPKGKFYFSVPIGKQRIEFNAHRVFSIKYLIRILPATKTGYLINLVFFEFVLAIQLISIIFASFFKRKEIILIVKQH